jgi:deoxyribonuclease V
LIFAIDVFYNDDNSAKASGVLFENWEDAMPLQLYSAYIPKVDEYVPGEFYRRELPCILELLKQVEYTLEYIVVDGYVDLNDKMGLGAHLYEALKQKIKVIGVAKTLFRNISDATYLYRGKSQKPLYITSAGVELLEAKEYIASMHGKYRFPTLLKEVDRLCRES